MIGPGGLGGALACLLAAGGAGAEVAGSTGGDDWIQLFNGRDLSGWTAKIRGHEAGDNHAGTFRVEDGVLGVSYEGYETFDDRFGHLFYETPFSHYRLRVEYRFTGEQVPGGPGWAFRNSGIMIHGQGPRSMGRDQSFPVSIEVQLLGGDGTDERPTANLCTPGTHVVMNGRLHTAHCTNSSSPTFHGDQWVSVELEVRGGELIRHVVGGETVIEYSQPQLDHNDPDARRLMRDDLMLRGGTISLQSESHPVEFRRVELLPLDEASGAGPGSGTHEGAPMPDPTPLPGPVPARKRASLETAVISTSRMHELAEFYRRGLELPEPDYTSEKAISFTVGSISLVFDLVESTPENHAPGAVALWFQVDDLEAAVERFENLGAVVKMRPTKKPWGGVIAAVVDPDGNIVGLSKRVSSPEP